MTMRISKYPALPSFGRDFHNVLPGSLPPVPPAPANPALLPMYLWTAMMANMASPEAISTESMSLVANAIKSPVRFC